MARGSAHPCRTSAGDAGPAAHSDWRAIGALTDEYREALGRLSLASFGTDTAAYFLGKATLAELRRQPSAERGYADSARAFLEDKVRERPQDDLEHARLAVAYAHLGRKDEAVREARRAVALLPLSKDARFGPLRPRNLAEIYVQVGERKAAIDQLEILVGLPGGITIPEFRTDPFWAPLRGNPSNGWFREK